MGIVVPPPIFSLLYLSPPVYIAYSSRSASPPVLFAALTTHDGLSLLHPLYTTTAPSMLYC